MYRNIKVTILFTTVASLIVSITGQVHAQSSDIYVIQKGDTLWSVAKEVYGDALFWSQKGRRPGPFFLTGLSNTTFQHSPPRGGQARMLECHCATPLTRPGWTEKT